MIKAKSLILFQGDSITDAARYRDHLGANDIQGLGCGYVNLIAAQLLEARPRDQLQIFNRGISGNRVVDLYARWKSDALNLTPDVISILIGVNDIWHEFGGGNGVELDRFETIYRMMLDYTRRKLPRAQLVLCEPFVLRCGVVTGAWLKDMRVRRSIVKKLAAEFKTRFAPFQAALDARLAEAPAAYWTVDGVHPTAAGHRVLADCWLETVA